MKKYFEYYILVNLINLVLIYLMPLQVHHQKNYVHDQMSDTNVFLSLFEFRLHHLYNSLHNPLHPLLYI